VRSLIGPTFDTFDNALFFQWKPKMDTLKKQIAEYLQLKEDIKRMMERKNQLEKNICSTMDEHEITSFELPNGSFLNYKVKESLTLDKKSKNK